MDPNQALADCINTAEAIQKANIQPHDPHNPADMSWARCHTLAELASDLAESFLALAGWIEMGGFLPLVWRQGQEATAWMLYLSIDVGQVFEHVSEDDLIPEILRTSADIVTDVETSIEGVVCNGSGLGMGCRDLDFECASGEVALRVKAHIESTYGTEDQGWTVMIRPMDDGEEG